MRQKLTEYEKYANQVVINSPVEWKVNLALLTIEWCHRF